MYVGVKAVEPLPDFRLLITFDDDQKRICIVSIEVRHSAFGYNDGFGEGRRGNQGTQVPPPAPPPSFFPLAG